MRSVLAWGVGGVILCAGGVIAAESNRTGPSTKVTSPVAVLPKTTLSMEGAVAVLNAAVADARSRGAAPSIAVVDDGGFLLCFQRMDGGFAAGAEVSLGKARTAAIFRKATSAFEDAINNGRFAMLDATKFTPLRGGIPVLVDGQVVGAIGVSGAASAAEDEQIAIAAAAVLASAASAAPR